MGQHELATEIRRRIRYNEILGRLFWRADPPRGRKIGDELSSCDNGNGYLYVSINRHPYAVHRIAWVTMTGCWPVEVDHRDTDKANNRWANLREATRSKNEMNKSRRSDNKSGFKGVGWHRKQGCWRAYIQKDNRQIHIGSFETVEAAAAAYAFNAKHLFGEFARLS